MRTAPDDGTPLVHAPAVPRDYRATWSISLDIPVGAIDGFGHMSAASYPAFVDRAVGAFFDHLFGHPVPDHVVAQYCVRFRRELVLDRGPVQAHASLDAVRGSAIHLTLVLEDAEGVPCTVVQYRSVAWDRERRRSRPLTDSELRALEAHLRPESPVLKGQP